MTDGSVVQTNIGSLHHPARTLGEARAAMAAEVGRSTQVTPHRSKYVGDPPPSLSPSLPAPTERVSLASLAALMREIQADR